VILASCDGERASRTIAPDFSSLAGEREFWGAWSKEHPSVDFGRLVSYFLEGDGASPEIPNHVGDELRAIARRSEIFVLVIRVNVDNGILEVVSLARNKHWQQTGWEAGDTTDWKADWKKSTSEPSIVKESVLRNLSGKDVCVEASDLVMDADSVFVFLRYKGECSRFAVYNPQYEDASHYDPDDATGKKIEKDPVAALLKSLFEMMGIRGELEEEG
jgi:hypothetical protein